MPCVLCSLPRQAWDLAVDICLSQLPTIIEEGTAFRVSPMGALWGRPLTWSAVPVGVGTGLTVPCTHLH